MNKIVNKLVEGFENEEDRAKFEESLEERNTMCFYIWKISLNLALRISDTLKITITEAERYLIEGYYLSRDKKTDKINRIKLNENSIDFFTKVLKLRKAIKLNVENEYLFVGLGNRSKSSSKHLSRIQVFRSYKDVTDYINMNINIATHSARKTWGLQVYKATKDISIVMRRLNHSSERVTLNYIGLTAKKMDKVADDFNF